MPPLEILRSARPRARGVVTRLTLTAAFACFFVVNPGFSAGAHPGNTASDGCHYCRTNCDDWGVPYDQRHCHGGGPPTTSPPTTSPPTTSPPPSTAPPSTAPRADESTPTTARAAPTTTTTAVGAPAPAEVDVEPGDAGDPRTLIAIEGEPGLDYELVVESEIQRRAGSIPAGGVARLRLLVENGGHTATAHLIGPEGGTSEPAVEEFEVSVPPPSEPTVSVSVVDDETVLVMVEDGPPFGVVTVDLDGDVVEVELSDSGKGEERVQIGPGDYEGKAVASDFQRQESEPVKLASFTVGDGDADDGSLLAGLGIVGLTAVGAVYAWRRRKRAPQGPLPPPPPPPPPHHGGQMPPPPPIGSAYRW